MHPTTRMMPLAVLETDGARWPTEASLTWVTAGGDPRVRLIPAGSVILPLEPLERAAGLQQLQLLAASARVVCWTPDPRMSPNARRQLEETLALVTARFLAQRVADSNCPHPSAKCIGRAIANDSLDATSVLLGRLAGLPASITPEIGLAAVTALIAVVEEPDNLLLSAA